MNRPEGPGKDPSIDLRGHKPGHNVSREGYICPQPDDLQLRIYPDPVLRQRCRPVEKFDDRLRRCVLKMFEVMYEQQGIGLAAPQVGWDARVFIVNVSADPENTFEERVFINPVLKFPTQQDRDDFEEGCLSLPGIRLDVDRPVDVKVTAFDVTGESFELEATDLLGRCIQHENDHLDGILIPSRVSTLRRLGIRSALKELEDEWKPVQ